MKDSFIHQRHVYKCQATGNRNSLPFYMGQSESVVFRKKRGFYKFTFLMLGFCLVVSISAVVVMPKLVGGAIPFGNGAAVHAAKEEIVACESIAIAQQQLGFSIEITPLVPAAAEIKSVNIVDGSVLEVNYTLRGVTYSFRVGEGKQDPSGDLAEYDYTVTESVGGVDFRYSGENQANIFLAIWRNGDYIFSLSSQNGLAKENLSTTVSEINLALAPQIAQTEETLDAAAE